MEVQDEGSQVRREPCEGSTFSKTFPKSNLPSLKHDIHGVYWRPFGFCVLCTAGGVGDRREEG